MRRSRLPLPKLYTLVQRYLEDSTPARLGQRGRPQVYTDALILTRWLYQTLWRASYREVLDEARQAGFPTPPLSTYHYSVRQLPLKLLQLLLARVGAVCLETSSTTGISKETGDLGQVPVSGGRLFRHHETQVRIGLPAGIGKSWRCDGPWLLAVLYNLGRLALLLRF